MSETENAAAAAEEEKKVPRRRRLTKDNPEGDNAIDQNDPTQYQGISTAVAVPQGETTRVHIAKSFTFHRDNHTSVTYTADGTNCDGEPGEYEMPVSDAENWFVQAHMVDPPPPLIPPMIGSPAHIEQLAAAAARNSAVQASLAQEEEMENAKLRDQRMDRARAALGPAVEKTEP